jgi:hypothetical protein
MKSYTCSTAALLMAASSTLAIEPLDLPDGSDFNLGDILFPGLHLTLAAGGSSEDADALALGAHDPNRDGFTLQGLELDLSLRLNEYVEGFTAWNMSWGGDAEEWTEEFEEAFGKLTNLPGGFEVRGGRMLNRFGKRNALHLHSWNTVDQALVNARFLGGEGLATEGADLTWYLPTRFTTALTVSYGEARAHDHGHGEEEHGEDHDEHEHGQDAEEIGFEDEFISGNLLVKANYDDFNQFAFGGSIAGGDNGLGDDTMIYGVNFSYTWRENGLEPGGRHWTWNTELMLREVDASAEHGHEHEGEHEDEHEDDREGEADQYDEDEHGHSDEEVHEDEADFFGDEEFGLYTELIYGPREWLDVGLRVGYVAGLEAIGLDERFRVSPLATIYLSKQKNLQLRFQYNYDDREFDGDAHSAWAQLQYSFGAPEVR